MPKKKHVDDVSLLNSCHIAKFNMARNIGRFDLVPSMSKCLYSNKHLHNNTFLMSHKYVYDIAHTHYTTEKRTGLLSISVDIGPCVAAT